MSTVQSAAATAAVPAALFMLAGPADGRCQARGPLTFASARRACALGARLLAQGEVTLLEIDCAGVTAADSAGLAVLLEWLAIARRAGRKLRYANVPSNLTALARISDLEELLGTGV